MRGNQHIMFRRTMAFAAGAALVLAGALAAQPAVATEPIKTGNGDAECIAAGFEWGIKLDTGDIGTYAYPHAKFEQDARVNSLSVTINGDNTFTWTNADPEVAAVLVKAAKVYTILPGGFEGSGGPTNTNGISHITFCYDDEPQNEPDEHLTVTKTVDTSYDRRHTWTLAKDVDTHEVHLYAPNGGGPATAEATWTIDVGYGGAVESDFWVTGEITILNDGEMATVVADVVDTMTVGMVDTDVMVDCGVDFVVDTVVLPVGDTLTCTYAHEVDSKVSGTNTAMATTLSGMDYSSAAMPIMWGEPDTELDESVTLTDVSEVDSDGDGMGDEREMTFDAPTGGTLSYSHTFDWADYDEMDECGDFTYDNLATLTSDDSDLYLHDTERVNVHVQCMVFQGETAWAANMGPLTDRYVKKGNWATYVTYTGGTKVYQLYAGQTTHIGAATIAPTGDGTTVTVTVELTGDWEFADAMSTMKIQTYAGKPSGNPSPGLFMYKTDCMADTCESGPIPIATYYGIHLDVGVWVPDPLFGP
jgi:hypothetical protein